MAMRIKQVRKLLRLSQEKFGKLAGVSKSAVSQWESDQTTPERDALFSLQKNARINPKWITDGIDPMFNTNARAGVSRVGEPLATYETIHSVYRPILDWQDHEDLPLGQYVLLARISARLSATNNRLVYEPENLPPLPFTTAWIKNKGLRRRNLVMLEAVGENMEPRIFSGNTLLIDRGETVVEDGRIYALRYGQQLRVQRLFRRYDGALIMQSYNQLYRDEIIPLEALNDQVEIIGRVVWSGGEIN